MVEITFAYLGGLALVDSINPCAIAVLTMVLISILTYNPQDKKKVLYSGLLFVLAIYTGYLIYGTLMIELFKVFAQFLRENSNIIYSVLATLAMILGALQVKDYFYYKPGGIATEMPIWMRPYAKKIISKIVSPTGAFFIGLLVTIFLLPCTIGPYIIASGLLAELGMLGALPWLIYYIFVDPVPSKLTHLAKIAWLFIIVVTLIIMLLPLMHLKN